MKFMQFLILITFTLGALAQDSAVADTYALYNFWYVSTPARNSVQLSWDYDGAARDFEFELSFKNYKSPATEKIHDVVFLKTDKNVNTFITEFEPARTISGGNVYYKKTISQADLDDNKSGGKYLCYRSVVDASHEDQTCYGFLAFLHENDWKSGDRGHNFDSGEKKAIIRWEFQLLVRYNLDTSTTVNTRIKTKVLDLPCSNCGCAENCQLNVDFELDHILCINSNRNQCVASNQHTKFYTFGEVAHILFFTNIKTRSLTLHTIHAYTDEETSGQQLDNNLHTNLNDPRLGYYFLSFPIAGPASQTGKDFSLKFVFKLGKHARRFLEDAGDRMLQSTGDPVEVSYTDVKGFRTIKGTEDSVEKPFQEEKKTKYPQMEKIYTLVFAVIAVSGLTCICAVVGNVLPFFKKDRYAELPVSAKA